MPWYRFRTVKHRTLPGVRFKNDQRVNETLADLEKQATYDLASYLRANHPGQTITTRFVHQRAEGLQCFVAITLFGPPEMEKEILEELAKKGEL